MVKKKVEKPGRKFTKHQLSRWQKQKRRQRIILIVGISVIAAVSGVIGGGWYTNEYQPMRETVIRVNDTEFNMKYYVNMLKVYGKIYEQVYGQDQTASYMQSLADEVMTIIERNELIRQAAMELGIMVSDSEVDEEFRSREPPSGGEFREMVRAEMILEGLREEYFDKQVPVSAGQRHIMAMFLESERQAIEVRTRLVEGEDFATLAGELSLDNLSRTENGDLGWHPEGILSERMGLSIAEDYAFSAEVGVLSQLLYDETRTKGVGYWLAKVLDRDEDEQGELFNVQVMLLGSEEEAQDVIARLESGEDFATLAEELSQHAASKEDGGDLGWLAPDEIYAPLKDFVLNSEAGILSEPMRDEMVVTEGGYWLVKVLDKEDNRQISDDDRNFLMAKALNEWASSVWDNPENEVEIYLDSEKKAWAMERAIGS